MDSSGIFSHFHPVIETALVTDKPVKIQLGGRNIVIFKGGDGFIALDDRCPHRHTPLSLGTVQGGRIHCPYHGWNFGKDGVGQVPLQPKLKCATRAYSAVDRLGYIWVADKDVPLSKLPKFVDDAENLTGEWAGCIRLKPIDLMFNAALPQTIDNFGEIEHVPFIHQVLGWSIDDVPEMQVDVKVGDDRTDSKGWGPQRVPPSKFLQLVDRYLFRFGDTSLLEWDFQFSPCHTTFTPGWGDAKCKFDERRAFSVRATSVFIPETENKTRLLNFPFVYIHEKRLRPLKSLVKYVAWKNLYEELVLDKKACEMVADVPNQLATMRLGIRDKQLVANRKLLQKIYYRTNDKKAGDEKNELASIKVADGQEVGQTFTV